MNNEVMDLILGDLITGPGEVICRVKEGSSISFYKIPCNIFGEPRTRRFQVMSIPSVPAGIMSADTKISEISILRKEIHITYPLVVSNERAVLVWGGQLYGEEMEDLKNVDLPKLQEIVSEAIEKQSCIIVDNISELISDIKTLES